MPSRAPGVADAYVYGVADDFFGEAVAAASAVGVSLLRPGPTEAALPPEADVTAEELLAWCASALGSSRCRHTSDLSRLFR